MHQSADRVVVVVSFLLLTPVYRPSDRIPVTRPSAPWPCTVRWLDLWKVRWRRRRSATARAYSRQPARGNAAAETREHRTNKWLSQRQCRPEVARDYYFFSKIFFYRYLWGKPDAAGVFRCRHGATSGPQSVIVVDDVRLLHHYVVRFQTVHQTPKHRRLARVVFAQQRVSTITLFRYTGV